MKRVIVLLAAFAIAVALTGCAESAGTPQAGEEGQAPHTVTVELEENPTTGYTWSYTMDNAGILEETGNEFVPGEASGEAAGVPGVHRYTFAAIADGTVKLSFEYKQEWDGGASDRVYCETYEVKDGVAELKGFSDSASSQSQDPQKEDAPVYISIDSISSENGEITVQAIRMKAGEEEESAFERMGEGTEPLTLSVDAKILYSEDMGPQTVQISAADFAKKFSASDAVYCAVITDGVIESLEFCYIP